jgi:hypothetical protein
LIFKGDAGAFTVSGAELLDEPLDGQRTFQIGLSGAMAAIP